MKQFLFLALAVMTLLILVFYPRDKAIPQKSTEVISIEKSADRFVCAQFANGEIFYLLPEEDYRFGILQEGDKLVYRVLAYSSRQIKIDTIFYNGINLDSAFKNKAFDSSKIERLYRYNNEGEHTILLLSNGYCTDLSKAKFPEAISFKQGDKITYAQKNQKFELLNVIHVD